MNKAPHPIDARIGQNLRLHRLAKNISQGELAKKLGITFQQVQKYEKGMNRIGSGRLVQIANILKIDLLQLFEGVDAGGERNVPSVYDLLDNRLSLKLLQAFSRIEDNEVRRALVVLAENAAEEIH